jgi:HD-GYP domain-containing protein (c-di-GMP phosphodiesterase class II)
MATFEDLRPPARLYVLFVIIAGAAVISISVHRLMVEPVSNRWLVLALLTLLTASFNLKIPSISAYISVSEAFVFASVLFFGTPAGTLTVVVECLVITLWIRIPGRATYRVLFNLAAPSVAIWASGEAFYFLSGIQPYSKAFTPLPTLFLPFLAFTALYFLLNSWLVALAVALEKHQPPLTVWWKNFAWLSVNYFSGAYVAALIVTYTKQLDFSALAIIVPLLVVSYVTFRTAIGRAEDSYQHLAELNRLYLSTIETLAMAIDAKDQITHGHIRRVQSYAVGLAKSIGISDDKLLKAIEAAALRHDMGKLAVPEHILNKPGKLTPAEFEKMKLHASVGADILSAIDFPYPVVPIVRHHHENWNGSGYPDGIKGTDIPIGARILSVVDCFDALTSDRPYRPRLSDSDALAILTERRGSMYDPLVVDTFVRVHRDIAPEASTNTAAAALVGMPTKVDRDQPHRTRTTKRGDVGVNSAAMSNPAILRNGFGNTASDIAQRLQGQIPFSLAVLFTYDAVRDELIGEHVFGDVSYLVHDLRISRGDRLSGWVAANRQTIVNSDPALDLGDIARAISPPLRASLSVPLEVGAEVVGVLTLYTSLDDFTPRHQKIAEYASLALAPLVAQWTVAVSVRT